MARLIKSLAAALLNATFLLLALCLFLGWKLMAEINAVTGRVTEAVQEIRPVQDRLTALQQEVAKMREGIVSRPADEISAQLAALDLQLASLQNTLNNAKELPRDVVREAAQSAAAELAGGAARLAQCRPPAQGSEAALAGAAAGPDG